MTLEESIQAEVNDTKQNKNSVRCRDCNSLILSPSAGDFTESTHSLPKYQQKTSASPQELECEDFKHFWLVKNMYTFENIGFSHTVNDKKYLICADCERGPIGFMETETKFSYVALERVKHVA